VPSNGHPYRDTVFQLIDGGDTVRQLQEYLHPCSEHWIDWFHITTRLTVLQQQAKALQAETASVRPGNIKTARKREALNSGTATPKRHSNA